jgi:uncharacterized membrane protein
MYFDLFNTLLLHDSMCYFIVLMSSLLFYNVENKNSWMSRCFKTLYR